MGGYDLSLWFLSGSVWWGMRNGGVDMAAILVIDLLKCKGSSFIVLL